MPHRDTNDNQTYDFVATSGEADGPYVTGGDPVIDPGNATVGTTTPADNATETPTATPADNETDA
jgi:hypothetical protein